MPEVNPNQERQIADGKVVSILAYLPFLCIVPLMMKKENEFVLFHGKQGLVIFLGEILVFIVGIIFPWVFKLGMFILSLMSFIGIIAVLKGRYFDLPVASKIAEKITL
jgi:fumarate reductase subunit D